MDNKEPIRWVYNSSKEHLLKIIVLTLIGMGISFIGVRLALVSRDVIDVATNNIGGNLIEKSAVLGLLIILQLLFQVLSSVLKVYTTGKLNLTFKRQLFSVMLYKDWENISAYHSGDLLNRMDNDITVVTSAVCGMIPTILSLITRIVLSFWALFVMDPQFAMIFLIAGPIIMLLSRIYGKKMKRLHKKCQESEGETRSFIQECLQNLLVIKSFGNEESMINNATNLQTNNNKLKIKRNNISIIVNILFFIGVTAGYYFALAWGAFKLSKDLITFGTLTAMLQLVGQVQVPFKNLSAIIPQYYSMLASAERIIEIEKLADEPDLNDEKLAYENIYDDLCEITIDRVSFSYGNEDVLKDVSYRIRKGDFISIHGRSGIGKSTLLKLLLGIITPQKGEIELLLNNGNKVPIDKNTRRLFAYVPQGNMILSGTIRENIAFSKEVKDDKAIIRCAEIAEIWEFIRNLPQGLNTPLGEKGLGLSEGQIQRLAIARSLYHGSPILLLDEATSALDETTEAAILRNLKRIGEITCIIVSHRKAVLDICDKHICFEDTSQAFV